MHPDPDTFLCRQAAQHRQWVPEASLQALGWLRPPLLGWGVKAGMLEARLQSLEGAEASPRGSHGECGLVLRARTPPEPALRQLGVDGLDGP